MTTGLDFHLPIRMASPRAGGMVYAMVARFAERDRFSLQARSIPIRDRRARQVSAVRGSEGEVGLRLTAVSVVDCGK